MTGAGLPVLRHRVYQREPALLHLAERALESGDTDTGRRLLYKAQMGGPKNRRLMKVLQEPGNKQLVQKMELDHISDKRLPGSKQSYRDIEEDLLFVLDDEYSHWCREEF